MNRATLALSACLALGIVSPVLAQNLTVMGSSVGVSLAGAGYSTLTVTGPDGFHMQTFSRGGSVALQLGAAGRLPDGIYNYEVTAAAGQKVPNRNTLDNGRGKEPAMVNVGVTRSGTFLVKNGAIMQPSANQSNSQGDKDG